MHAPDRAVTRLTQFGHGGGCGCKIAPPVLSRIPAKSLPGIVPQDLLVGVETADDAAVYRINDSQAIVATAWRPCTRSMKPTARFSPIRRLRADC
jgi:selenophosphate synthase